MVAAETYWTIVTNPGHIGAELTWSIILDIVLIQPVRWLVKRHDRRNHPLDASSAKVYACVDAPSPSTYPCKAPEARPSRPGKQTTCLD